MKQVALILTLLCGLLCASGCIKDEMGPELKVGDSIPDFNVVMNDGANVSDETLKGFKYLYWINLICL